ncbi:MAG: nucleotide-binding universal stress UspA family protein [Paraglaciecola sp.]|jgi:nucleotide-binding universal stress UspA family protein
MPDLNEKDALSVSPKSSANGDKVGQPPKVVVCAETASSSAKVIPHAMALSNALGIELQLVHVIEPRQALQFPLDPFEWDLRRREAEAFVTGLSKQYGSKKSNILTQVLQGRTSDKICSCLVDNDEDIAALCRSDVEQPGHIGQTARRVLEKAVNSVLIVPPSADQDVVVNYQRILIPLDGSARAEGVLFLGKKIAQASNATLILIHAIPDPVLTEIDALDNEDIELRDSLLRRNERVARDYLDRIAENISASGLTSTSVILNGSDARRLLNDAIIAESADLLILSSHGHSGHADVATGDVTSYLLANASVPILMIRRPGHNGNHGGKHLYRNADSKGVRRPTGAK